MNGLTVDQAADFDAHARELRRMEVAGIVTVDRAAAIRRAYRDTRASADRSVNGRRRLADHYRTLADVIETGHLRSAKARRVLAGIEKRAAQVWAEAGFADRGGHRVACVDDDGRLECVCGLGDGR